MKMHLKNTKAYQNNIADFQFIKDKYLTLYSNPKRSKSSSFLPQDTTILEWKMTTPPIVANSLLTFDYKPNGLSGKDNGECKFIWSIWRVKENLLFSP